jgi:hypothetical protein
VRVFGSFARGDANEESDVDFLIEAGPHTPPWFPGGLLVDLQEGIGPQSRCRRREYASSTHSRPRASQGHSLVRDDRLYVPFVSRN